MLKTCYRCCRELPLSDFYKHNGMADGHLNKCKECCKKESKTNRKDNIEYYRKYDTERAKLPHRVEAAKEYRLTEAGKRTVYKSTKNYRAKNPERRALYAFCERNIKRQSVCSDCGSSVLVEMHHDDYNKPLEVRWLCRRCHREWHKHNKPILKTTT